MPSSLSAAARFFSISLVAAVAAADPAIAGTPVPGPILGVGAPVLAVFAVGYYLIRKSRAR